MNTLYIENIDNQYNKLSDSAIPLYKLLFLYRKYRFQDALPFSQGNSESSD